MSVFGIGPLGSSDLPCYSKHRSHMAFDHCMYRLEDQELEPRVCSVRCQTLS